MPRYVVHLAYDGTDYFGWQKQPDVQTVQGTVERAIRTVTQEEVQLYASGRTDTGVHAESQYAHFDTHIPLDEGNLNYRLRSLLPDDIHIYKIFQVPEYFHARFDAEWRQYRYQLLFQPDPFQNRYSWYPGEKPDPEVIQECMDLLQGVHDFAGFSRKSGDLPHSRCTIHLAEIELKADNMMIIRIRANRFLRSMLRAIVGGMVRVSHGKKSKNWFERQLKEEQELKDTTLAPAKGLCLEKVFYPDSAFDLT